MSVMFKWAGHFFSKKNVKIFPGRPKLLKKAAVMVGARIVGLGFGAIGAVWAARCLGPKNLGISGMVQNVVQQAVLMIGVLSPTVLIREYKSLENDEERSDLLKLTNGFRLLLALGFCILAVPFLTFRWLPDLYLRVGWMFIPILLVISIQPIWIFQAAEKQQFQSMIAVFQPALTALIYLFFFRPGMSAGADLIAITTVATVLLVVYWTTIYKLTPLNGNFFSFQGLEKIWSLTRKSRWLYVMALAMYIYTLLEQPLLGWLYSVEELGKYRTAVKVTDALNGTFAIIPMILFPRFIEWRKRGEAVLWNRQMKLTVLFAAGGAAAATAGFILIPRFYPLVFGVPFAQAGIPCAILVLSKIVTIVSGIYGWGLLTDHRYDKKVSIAMILTAVFSLGANFFFIPRFGMYGASLINLASEVIILMAMVRLTVRRHRALLIS